MTDDTNFDRARAAMTDVRQDVKSGVRAVSAAAGAAARDVRRDVSETVRGGVNPELMGEITDKARGLASAASDKVTETTSTMLAAVEDYTIDQPWQALAFAALGGTIVGALLYAGRR